MLFALKSGMVAFPDEAQHRGYREAASPQEAAKLLGCKILGSRKAGKIYLTNLCPVDEDKSVFLQEIPCLAERPGDLYQIDV